VPGHGGSRPEVRHGGSSLRFDWRPEAGGTTGLSRPDGATKKRKEEGGSGLSIPGAHATGLLSFALPGLHKVDGFLSVALCVLGLLCVGSVAFLPYPRFPSAFSAASAVRSAPLLPLRSIRLRQGFGGQVRNPQSTFAEATADKSAICPPPGHAVHVHSQNSIPYMVLGRALTPY